MSSYIVDKKHIEQIVLYVYKLKGIDSLNYYHNKERVQFETMGSVAHELSLANCESVNYKYDENNKPFFFDDLAIDSLKVKNPLQVIQLIRCLEYQSFDNPDYKNSLAYSILKTITDHIVFYMVQHECELHSTESYKLWDFNEDNILSYVRVQVVHKSQEVA
jgi:hypothetical protein|tara:strand:- start:295 stop:780 length:486 start_codon:yes stop_codon:yes gene_type:complete